jgi:hypothetical protein
VIYKNTISGLPKWLYWKRLRLKSRGLKPRTKPLKKKVSKKNKVDGLFEFMMEMVARCNWICDECGERCYASDQTFQMAAQAHLLPKKTVKSVALDPRNIKCLPSYGCGCHSKYDKSWASAQKMRIWPDVEKIILEELIPKLRPDEYKKLPSFLKDKYEKFEQD